MATPSTSLAQHVSDPQDLAQRATRTPVLLESVCSGLNAKDARTRYGCAKALRVISQDNPEKLYPRFDFFVRLLDAENKIMQWEALFVLSHLARVDTEERFASIIDRYLSSIPGPTMITAANAIRGGARIALAKPPMANRIAREILKVSEAGYETAECRNVAIGHAITALGEMAHTVTHSEPVVAFVRRQVRNPRPATRKKAELFLKRFPGRAPGLEA